MSEPLTVYLWDREDGEEPKAIGASRPAPGPGTVWVVHPLPGLPGRAVDRARKTLAMSKVDTSGMSNTAAGPYLDARDAVQERAEEDLNG